MITTGRDDHLLYAQKNLLGKNNDFAFNSTSTFLGVLNSGTICTFSVLGRRAHDRDLLLRKHSQNKFFLDRLYDTYVQGSKVMLCRVCGFRVRVWESYRTSRILGYGYESVTGLPEVPGTVTDTR